MSEETAETQLSTEQAVTPPSEPPVLLLDEQQEDAIAKCTDLANRCWPVTGPAGTGKTTIIKRVYAALTDQGKSVAVAAPTGKAAKRITEATGIPAVTFHRLLEYPHPGERDPKTGRALRTTEPKRNASNPLPHDVILGDEYAMVNTNVHQNIRSAIKNGAVLRCFGDVQQLKPIEENKTLQDQPSPFMRMLKDFGGTTLTTIHRQGEGSGIVFNASMVLRGRMPIRRPDFDVKITDSPTKVLEDFVLESLDNGINFNSLEHQILTPANKSWVGTHKLNAVLQSCFRESLRDGHKLDRHTWDAATPITLCVGDKVVNAKNNYDLELFNGEVGIVKEITEYAEIVVDLGDREVIIPPVQIIEYGGRQYTNYPHRDLYLAYAMTTHKAQGSEYQHVCYVLNKSSGYAQERSNTYTAITRARKHVTLITDQRSLTSCLQLKKPMDRR